MFGFDKGQAVDIHACRGELIISHHTPRCVFCQETKDVIEYQDKVVCTYCVKRMVAKINE